LAVEFIGTKMSPWKSRDAIFITGGNFFMDAGVTAAYW